MDDVVIGHCRATEVAATTARIRLRGLGRRVRCGRRITDEAVALAAGSIGRIGAVALQERMNSPLGKHEVRRRGLRVRVRCTRRARLGPECGRAAARGWGRCMSRTAGHGGARRLHLHRLVIGIGIGVGLTLGPAPEASS
jgi:hypothetical protein